MTSEIERVARAICSKSILVLSDTPKNKRELIDEQWPLFTGQATAAIAAMVGWRPIAEHDATDETAVLVFSSDGMTVGRKSYGTWIVDNAHGYCEDGQIYGVTHWMPLPPKPEGAL